MDIVTTGLLALIAALALIALLVPIAERLALPLPTVVAVVGLMIGSAVTLYGVGFTEVALDSYDAWFLDSLAIDSQALLFVFLPPLLFEMALAVDVRRLFEDLTVVMLMAVVAVIAATLMVGGALFWVSDLTIIACLLLGATISTTDPAAVITIFKKLGAPKRLLVILEGESLLNDAAAIALFTILIASLAPGQSITITASIGAFAYAFGVGAFTGFVLAQLVSLLYPFLKGSELAETSLTVALAYAAFLAAELGFGASGVVAVVVAGLTTVVVGAMRMGPRNWPPVTAVWNQIGFWANGLILLIGALIAPRFLLSIQVAEIGYLGIVVAAAFAARGLMLFGMLPAISRLGLTTSMNQRQKTLIWWGGVRGAVTLILTLSLSETTALSAEERAVLGTLGCGFVFVTLLLNAATLAGLTRWLGLDKLSSGDRRLREQVIAVTMDQALDHVVELAERRGIDPDIIDDIEQAYDERMVETERAVETMTPPFGERLRLGLTILASQEKRLVRRRFEDGVIGVKTSRILRTQADRLADAARLRGRDGYEEMMTRLLAFPDGFRLLLFLQRWLRIERPLARQLARRFDVLAETESALSELFTFNENRMAALIGEDATDNLQNLLDKRAALIRKELDALELQYPHYARALGASALLRAGLRWEEARYGQLFRDGVVNDEVYRSLTSHVDRLIQASRKRPHLDIGLDPQTMLAAVPLFRDLDVKDRRWLGRRLKSRLVAPGERIITRDERGYEMYFIASGVVEVQILPKAVTLKTGDFFGEIALLGPARRRSADVVALGFCRLLVLRQGDVRKLVSRNRDVAAKIKTAAAARGDRARPAGGLASRSTAS